MIRCLAVAALAAIVGCSTPPPPPRVPVPQSSETGAVKTYEPLRPLPQQAPPETLPPPAFNDVPLVTQAPPEQPAFLEAYNRVGKPRIVVFVNRTIEGHIVLSDLAQQTDSNGKYLGPGEYDEVQAKSIDYQAIELALADTLGANGRVTLVSPMMARQRLTDQEVKELQDGREQVLREVAEKLDADVLIQVQARPTKQTSRGLGVRVLAEAINTKGGESVARSYVDIDPPLDKPTINDYTRFLGRKLMQELAGSWNAMGAEPTTKP